MMRGRHVHGEAEQKPWFDWCQCCGRRTVLPAPLDTCPDCGWRKWQRRGK